MPTPDELIQRIEDSLSSLRVALKAPAEEVPPAICPICSGAGYRFTVDEVGPERSLCDTCEGRGTISAPTPVEWKLRAEALEEALAFEKERLDDARNCITIQEAEIDALKAAVPAQVREALEELSRAVSGIGGLEAWENDFVRRASVLDLIAQRLAR